MADDPKDEDSQVEKVHALVQELRLFVRARTQYPSTAVNALLSTAALICVVEGMGESFPKDFFATMLERMRAVHDEHKKDCTDCGCNVN